MSEKESSLQSRRAILRVSGAALLGGVSGCSTLVGSDTVNENSTPTWQRPDRETSTDPSLPDNTSTETTAEKLEDEAAAGGIVAGTAPGNPPFDIKRGGDLTGFDIELFEAIIAKTSYEFAGWQEFEFIQLIPALVDGEIDAFAAAMTIRTNRDRRIDFSDPYYSANQSVLIRLDSKFQPTRLEDLSGHPIAAKERTNGESLIEHNLIKPGKLDDSNFTSYQHLTTAVDDLEVGKIDAIVLDQTVAQALADLRSTKIAFTHNINNNLGLGVPEGDRKFQTAINDGLESVRKTGVYQELRNKWFVYS